MNDEQKRVNTEQRRADEANRKRMTNEQRRADDEQRRMERQMIANQQTQNKLTADQRRMEANQRRMMMSSSQMDMMPSQMMPQMNMMSSQMPQMNMMPPQMSQSPWMNMMPQQSPRMNMMPQQSPRMNMMPQQSPRMNMMPQMSQSMMPPQMPQMDMPSQMDNQSQAPYQTPSQTPQWQREFGRTYNPREIHERYEQLRNENPDRHGELNTLWEQARVDIKKRMKERPKRVSPTVPQGGEADVSKIDPKVLIPGNTDQEMTLAYKTRRARAVEKGRTKLIAALDRAYAIRKRDFKNPSKGSPSKGSPSKGSPSQKQSPSHSTVKLKDGSSQSPSPSPSKLQTLDPKVLIPGNNPQEITMAYKTRRAAAVAKGRAELVAALDKAYAIRKQQGTQQIKKYSGLSQVPNSVLLPGKTPQDIESGYRQKRAMAVKKGRTQLVVALDAAHKRLISGQSNQTQKPQTQLKPQRASSGKSKKYSGLSQVPNAVLLPGKNPQDIESGYRQKRAMAAKKGRTQLVSALNAAYKRRVSPLRRRPEVIGKSTAPRGQLVIGKKVGSPTPSGDWKRVFVGVDHSNPRAVSEKYQSMRKMAKPEDVGKLNALFKKAIQDIKVAKRQQTQTTAGQKQKAQAQAQQRQIVIQKQKTNKQKQNVVQKQKAQAQKAQAQSQAQQKQIADQKQKAQAQSQAQQKQKAQAQAQQRQKAQAQAQAQQKQIVVQKQKAQAQKAQAQAQQKQIADQKQKAQAQAQQKVQASKVRGRMARRPGMKKRYK